MSTRNLCLASLGLCLANSAHGALVDRTTVARTDYFAQAESALALGKTSEAEKVLRENAARLIAVDEPRYIVLKGRVRLTRNDFESAAKTLRHAIELRKAEAPAQWQLLLGQALHGAEKWHECSEAMIKSEGAWKSSGTATVQYARCLERSGSSEVAWKVLDVAAFSQPAEKRLVSRARIEVLLARKAMGSATKEAIDSFAREVLTEDDMLAFAQALRGGGHESQALLLLETARLTSNNKENLLLEIARNHVARGQMLPAARAFEELARLNSKYIEETAELFRRAGESDKALHYNAQIENEQTKLRQRLSILVGLQDDEGAISLLPDLERVGLLADEDVRYGVAYSAFRTGEMSMADRFIRGLSRADLIKKGNELRKRMAALPSPATHR